MCLHVHAAGITSIAAIPDASLERISPMRVTNPTVAGAPTLSCFSSINAVSALRVWTLGLHGKHAAGVTLSINSVSMEKRVLACMPNWLWPATASSLHVPYLWDLGLCMATGSLHFHRHGFYGGHDVTQGHIM